MDIETFSTTYSSLIRAIPDFPKPGILFRDINPLIAEPKAFRDLIDLLAVEVEKRGGEAIVGLESRGFIFGAPLAYTLSLPLILVRKAGKLPGEVQKVSYSLEYGSSAFEIQKDVPIKNKRAMIVDDLLATGGTAVAAAELIRSAGGVVAGAAFAIELKELAGRKRLVSMPVSSLMTF